MNKYGLGKKSEGEAEGEEQQTGAGTGAGARPKEKTVGRRAMTEGKKEMIKGGSIISLGCQGAL